MERTIDELAKHASDPSAWKILPNLRLGMALPILSNGRQTYLAADGKSRLCEHGEMSSLIAMMMCGARPRRGSCDCQNLDGLTAARYHKTRWSAPPVSYYDVLVASRMDEIELPGGRMARRLPASHTMGESELCMLPSGNIRCIHGNAESTVKNHAKGKCASGNKCPCHIQKRSWRLCRLQNLRAKESRAGQMISSL